MDTKVKKIGKGNRSVAFVRHAHNRTYILSPCAHLVFCAVITKASKKEATLEIRLDGACARADIIFAYIGKASDKLRLRIIIRHRAHGTYARVWGRSVLFNSAESDISGIHGIEKEASGADTYFSHHALLLSPYARVSAAPFLEILSHDVRAGHAATSGSVSHDALIYLQTRGISPEMANNLFVGGFVNADSGKIPVPRIEKKFKQAIQALLSDV